VRSRSISSAVARAQAVDRVDGDREEADERDDDHLRADAEAAPDDDERRDRGHRDELGDHEPGIEGVLDEARADDGDRERDADDDRDAVAEQDLRQRRPGARREHAAVAHERAGDLERRRAGPTR
jgi:hypothetical protein